MSCPKCGHSRVLYTCPLQCPRCHHEWDGIKVVDEAARRGLAKQYAKVLHGLSSVEIECELGARAIEALEQIRNCVDYDYFNPMTCSDCSPKMKAYIEELDKP